MLSQGHFLSALCCGVPHSMCKKLSKGCLAYLPLFAMLLLFQRIASYAMNSGSRFTNSLLCRFQILYITSHWNVHMLFQGHSLSTLCCGVPHSMCKYLSQGCLAYMSLLAMLLLLQRIASYSMSRRVNGAYVARSAASSFDLENSDSSVLRMFYTF